MKYAYTVLNVINVEKTIKFYENAFGFSCGYMSDEKNYAELNTGETKIVFAESRVGHKDNNLHSKPEQAIKEGVLRVELSFVSDDIVNDYNKAIRFGAKVYEELQKKPWGQMTAYLIDINGFLIGMSNSD